MNYRKAMIDFISESRRRASSADKSSIIVANPYVLIELHKIYHDSNDTVLKAIIKETFQIVGGQWPDTLVEGMAEYDVVTAVRVITKVYRGQTQLVEVPPEGSIKKTKTERRYRGQVVI
jgi:hypothetical protein